MRQFPERTKVPLRVRGEVPGGLEGVLWLGLGSSAHCGVHLGAGAPYCVALPGPLEGTGPAQAQLEGMPSRLLTMAHEVRVRRAAGVGIEVGVKEHRDAEIGIWHRSENGIGLINAFDDAGGALAIDIAQRSPARPDVVGVLRWGVSPRSGLVSGRPLIDVLLRHVCADPNELGHAPSVLYGLEPGAQNAALVRHPLSSGRVVRREPDFGQLFGPPALAAGAAHAGAKHSWLVVCVRDVLRDQVELCILSTSDLQVPAVAALRLPPAVRWDQPAVWINDHDDDSWLPQQIEQSSDA
jgi:hypothetical protein